jgi:tetratricopeptide (TPR) repeat protein
LSFEKPERGDEDVADISKNFYVLTRHARKLLREKKWKEARAPLEKLIKLFPANTGPDNAYWLLAQAHRGLNETNAERAVLTTLANLEADDIDTFGRLMEIEAAATNWLAVVTNAGRYLAVNPLVAPPYRHLAQASEALDQRETAIRACKTLLLLDPPDPAGAHFQLARLLYKTGDAGAKRQVLQALEEAPRFREANKLLLEINRAALQKTNAPPAPPPSGPAPAEKP